MDFTMFLMIFSAAFRTATIKNTHRQSLFEAAVCRIFAKSTRRKIWRSPLEVKLRKKNSKNIYFPERTFHVYLPLSLRVWRKSCQELTQPTFSQVPCEILKLGFHLLKNSFYLLQWRLYKKDEKCFLFDLKSSCRSQDVYIFVMTFWSCRKNVLIWKIRLNSKSMTSQPG